MRIFNGLKPMRMRIFIFDNNRFYIFTIQGSVGYDNKR